MNVSFRQVEAGEVRPLRTLVLRPDWPDGEWLEFDADEAESSYHFALIATRGTGEEVLAVLTWLVEQAPGEVRKAAESNPDALTYRLRGMAVAESNRREGYGARLLQGSLVRLALHEPTCDVVWCNARVNAVGFYQREGFEAVGDTFEVEGVGPHRVMWRYAPTLITDEGDDLERFTA